jgi:hypothetical protein
MPPERLPSRQDGTAGGDAFYRYRNAEGRIVIVDSLARVPPLLRGHAEGVVLATPTEAPGLGGLARELHWPSFLAGASVAVVTCLLFLALRRTGKRLLRVAFVLGLTVLGVGLYLGWARRMAGESAALISSPSALIDDARAAVEKMNQHNIEQQRALQELEREAH